MPRKPRIQYPGALYPVLKRGDQRDDIYYDEVDRQDFVKTLAETCQQTGCEVHAYCLMRNHFHLVVEPPNANLVAGRRWFLSRDTLRRNPRRKLCGHVFSGRYKALAVEGSATGYRKTGCDSVQLNPVRAHLLRPEDRWVAYPWSRLIWYAAAREHRPFWLRVDRLLGEHGIPENTAAGRAQLEAQMEARRAQETAPEALAALESSLARGWCLGSEALRQQLREPLEGRLGEHPAGALKLASAAAKAERIIAQELERLGGSPEQLARRPKCAPEKLARAGRLRAETPLSGRWLAARLHLGSWKSASSCLPGWSKNHEPEPQQKLML
ncbi:MAG TPA: transposase [Bacillota bacterium]|nr:transposase [Bacillota bacterium]